MRVRYIRRVADTFSVEADASLQQEVERLQHERDALAKQCKHDALTFEEKLRSTRETGTLTMHIF